MLHSLLGNVLGNVLGRCKRITTQLSLAVPLALLASLGPAEVKAQGTPPFIPSAQLAQITDRWFASEAPQLICFDGEYVEGRSARFGVVPFVKVTRVRRVDRLSECERSVGAFILVHDSTATPQVLSEATQRLFIGAPQLNFAGVVFGVRPIPHPDNGRLIDAPQVWLRVRYINVAPSGPRS